METPTSTYPARLDVNYPQTLDRVTTAFRIIWIIPIAIVLGALSATATSTVTVVTATGEVVSEASRTGGGIIGGLFVATLMMILVRQRYPRWWFDFALQFNRFAARVAAYAARSPTPTPPPLRSSRCTSTSTTPMCHATSTGGCRWSSGCS